MFAKFNDNEVQKTMLWTVKNYKLPKTRTTYTEVHFNFDDDTADVFHIVFGEAVVDLAANLHHFTVIGCPDKFPAGETGVPGQAAPSPHPPPPHPHTASFLAARAPSSPYPPASLFSLSSPPHKNVPHRLCLFVVIVAMSGKAKAECNIPLCGSAGWAPGATLWDMPTTAGCAIGKGAGINAVQVQVHYTDADRAAGDLFSNDAIKLSCVN